MSAFPPTPAPVQNHILASMPTEVQNRLFPYLELEHLARGKVIYEIGEKPRYAHFPTDAVVAELGIIESGASTEISMVGNEGVVGTGIFLGGQSSSRQAVVQSEGYAYRLLGNRLKDEFDRHGEMMGVLLRYTQALMTQTAQTAMCNRHHSIDQQLCRMLLQVLDRMNGPELIMTQESIASMLGVRRESVTEAAGRMKNLGLIECRRGRVKVLDRAGIERRCCECYAVVKRETDRLLPHSAVPHHQQQIPLVSGL